MLGSNAVVALVVATATWLATARRWTAPPAGRDVPTPGAAVERRQGTRAPAMIAASFDGLGYGFVGPQGSWT